MKHQKTKNTQQVNDVLDETLAKSIVTLLDEHAQQIDASQVAKLVAARQQALQARTQLQAIPVYSLSGFSTWVSGYFTQHRALMSSGMALGVVLFAFIVVQPIGHNNIEHGDASLLGSDLPPEAYADKGFDSWLGKQV